MFEKFKTYTVAAFVVFASIVIAPLSAQEPLDLEDGTFRILRVGGIDDEAFLDNEVVDRFPTDIRYESKEGEIELSINSRRPSKPYPMPRGKMLELYRWLPIPPGSPEDTEPQKQILAQIPISSASKQLIFVAEGKVKNAAPIRGLAISDMDEDHLPGQARLINLSSFNAGMAMEDEKGRSKARSADTIIQFAPGMTDIIIAIEYQKEGQWAQALSRKLRLNERIKVYAVLYDFPPTPDEPLPVRGSIFSERVRSSMMPEIR